MAFVKVRKSKPYFKRFQTKFRRRREGKTDYQARRNMIIQDKDKYNTPKYRFVVRRTNTKIICQIAYATLQGDRILAQSDSQELKRFGLTAGFTNYASSYATGLLLARRVIKQLGLDKLYAGNTKIDGADYDVAEHAKEGERKPFLAVLDVGLIRTTTGNRVFGALKGATDGGLNIPHNTKRFPGTSSEDQKYDAKKHRERIFGNHVNNYITELKKEDQDSYKRQFSKWDECLKKAGVDTVEKLYTKIHSEIRSKPERAAKKARTVQPQKFDDKRKTVVITGKGKYLRQRRFTLEERKKNIEKKIQIAQKKGGKK